MLCDSDRICGLHGSPTVLRNMYPGRRLDLNAVVTQEMMGRMLAVLPDIRLEKIVTEMMVNQEGPEFQDEGVTKENQQPQIYTESSQSYTASLAWRSSKLG